MANKHSRPAADQNTQPAGNQPPDFSLGDAGQYAIVAFAGTRALQLGANATVDGNVGVNGPGADINTFAATAKINGNLALAGTSNTNYGTKVSGNVTTRNGQVGTDVSYLTSLSASLASDPGTSLALTGTKVVQANSGTADSAGDYVFNVTSATAAYNLVVQGDGTHDVVFNIASGVAFNLNNVTLVGGLKPSQVLFNDTGTTAVTSTSGSTFQATILAPSASVALRGNTVTGGVYANTVALTAGATVDDPVCFAAGTLIGAPGGAIAVERLAPGDRVITVMNGMEAEQAVRWIGRRRIDLRSHPSPARVTPVRIAAGAFGPGVPKRDLLVSPDHGLFAGGKLICARQLINYATITQSFGARFIDYYHVELASHAILLAEGLAAESYLDTGNRGFFTNGGLPLLAMPSAAAPDRETASCVPFVWQEADVKPVWERLAKRAASLGLAVDSLACTADPELCLFADGRLVQPVDVTGGRYTFVVPPRANEVRIVSRSAAPTDTRPWMEDRRRLGVYVERIVFKGRGGVHEVPLDHPGLTQGWWDVERDRQALRRWTDGAAAVPVPPLDGPVLLELKASNSGLDYPRQAERARYAA